MNGDFDKLILKLIPEIREGDAVSIHDPKSPIIGCCWIFGVWCDKTFVRCSMRPTRSFPSDINTYDLTENNCYSIQDFTLETLHTARDYTVNDLTDRQLIIYNGYKELLASKADGHLTDMWDVVWEHSGGDEHQIDLLCKLIPAVYKTEMKLKTK